MTTADPAEQGFGNSHIVEPRAGHPHTHTAILLHGRGSTGEEFSEELFEMFLSQVEGVDNPGDPRTTLADKLPTWRWVFPSSACTWNTTFEEWVPAWFEAYSLADPTSRQDLQPPGLRASAGPVDNADGAASRLVLGGISLGGATALWTLLGTNRPERPLGGFVVVSSWLPFANDVEKHLGRLGDGGGSDVHHFVLEMTEPLRLHIRHQQQQQQQQHQQYDKKPPSVLDTLIFGAHGRDDAFVDIELGRHAQQVLTGVGLTVQWHEYEGAEQEGHWIKEPEEMDDLKAFFDAVERRTL
ncbi:hypothetical protein SPBR_01922 [Sporothrix brasiliensis 5110]|uniref:Phospholipase/carboxylesterase/thioesterase domain-containing protein n=1 Tax=Sporothrix brasiliensis 5110 TaxID=1398154 RepID=A0A0C2FKA6_9PEZI|nr:uncharacterized protein SPBR_01922 [Sporothrix brasiliensis 5110]KIH91493.1 hypothetical protein SPBR_01922 [Sporothrix brasiliensis 5110]